MKNGFILALVLSFFVAVDVKRAGGAGAAPTPYENPESNSGALKGQVVTGGSYDANSGNATRVVNDLQVPGALGAYGLDFTRYWNSVHNEETNEAAHWPTDFGYSGWSHSWQWNAVYDEEIPDFEPGGGQLHTWTTSITITFPDGHATKFKLPRSNGEPWYDGRCGPTYHATHNETELWPEAGEAVHDRLAKMASNGSEFWLYRADGGAVRFVGVFAEYNTGHAWWHYRAKEVYDPYGFRTELLYQEFNQGQDWLLREVKQEGDRSLILTWGGLGGLSVITKVETGGPAAGQQVNYYYSKGGAAYTLAQVQYQNEPALNHTTSAYYGYSRVFGDDPNTTPNDFPMLKSADDPHFAGAMTKIRYKYRGWFCDVPQWPDPSPPPHFHSWFYFTAHAIDEERSGETGQMVSRFGSPCNTGERWEENGIGGRRSFYFGDSANDPEVWTIYGYNLTKVTDFGRVGQPPESRPFRKQAGGSEPGTVWDGRDIDTHFEYNTESGSPSKAIYKDGSFSTYDWTTESPSAAPDPQRIHNKQRHWLFSERDERNQLTVYKRDSRRRVTDIFYHDAAGTLVASESYSYNDLNQVTTHTLPSGAIQTYVYNALHQLVWEENSANEEQKEYIYDGLGRVEKVRDTQAIAENAPYTERMEYNGRHLITKIHYRPTGGSQDPTVTYEYDRYGNRTAVIDELGHRKDSTYDSYRRCTSTTEQIGPGPGCNTGSVRRWDWIYDRVIEDEAGNPGPSIHASAHTSKEWRIQIEPAFNDLGHRRATSRTFDVNNRMLSEQTGLIQLPGAPLGTFPPPGADTETHRVNYDENGQKQTTTDPLGRVTTYGYDNRNRLETTTEPKRENQPAHPVTRFNYDVAGNKTMVTFPDMKTQRWENYDAFGQAREFFDERNNRTDLTYRWGPMKKLDTVRTYRQKDNPPGGTESQETNFDYDGMGRPTWTIFPDGSKELNGYELGKLSAFKTRKNQTKRLHYDARGRELYHTWDADAAPRVDRIWDDANRMTRIWNIFSTIDYQYDEAGQVRTEGTTVAGDGVVREVRYCRYPNGEVSQITYPNGSTVVNRFYTARGQLQGVGWGAGSTSYVYLPDGKVDYQARSNGVTTSYGYDGRGMIGWLRHSKNGYDLAKRDYWRDDRDRILAWKRGSNNNPNGMEDGRGDRYKYDAEGQLERAWYRALNPQTEEPGDPKRGDEFYYDALGNRMGSNRVASRGLMTFERDDNGLNQYRAWWPYSVIRYDDDVGNGWGAPGAANGVLMEDGWITAGFNALNQPICIWSKAYQGTSNWMWFGYDPLGRCVKRWVAPYGAASTNATYYYYDGWNLIQEGPAGGTADRAYVHGGRVDEIVASQAGGVWMHHHYDARGHCIMLTDTDGVIREQYDYDAFGLPYFYDRFGTKLGTSAQWGNRFLFTGREWIKDLKLYDYRNRMYQPELGRFLQPDPKHFEAGDYNLYRYCHNDPVNKADPFGLLEITEVTLKMTIAPSTGSNIFQVVEVKLQAYSSFIDAGKAAGKAAHNPKSVTEYHGRIGQVLANPGLFIYGPPVRGTHDTLMNYSSLTVGRLPDGVKDVASYWVLGRHQDAHSWPVNKRTGKSDLTVLKENHRSAVLTNPPAPGQKTFTHKVYDADNDREGQ